MAIQIQRKGIITDRYTAYLDIFCAFQKIKLAPKEKAVLNAFFWINEGNITTESRKEVCKKLNMTQFNLTNVIGKIRKKRLLAGKKKDTEDEMLIPALIPNIEANNKSFVVFCELVS